MEATVWWSLLEILLLAIFFLSLLMEIKTGGMGLGVLLGLVAAGVFFGSQYVKGLVSFMEVGMFLLGILAILAEALLPTMGLLGGVGALAMLYSLVLSLGGDVHAVYALLISVAVAIVAFLFLARHLPQSSLWKKVVLKDASTEARGYVSAQSDVTLLGKEGEVLTDVRPAGTAKIEGTPVDVVSEGAYIEKGAKIRVLKVEGNRVVVRRI